MKDPFGVKTSGELKVACQILHIDRREHSTLIDLVTLEPCERAGEELPAGTPLALAFKYEPLKSRQDELEAVVGSWERDGAVLAVEARDAPTGICYEFSSGDNQLVLLVQEQRR